MTIPGAIKCPDCGADIGKPCWSMGGVCAGRSEAAHGTTSPILDMLARLDELRDRPSTRKNNHIDCYEEYVDALTEAFPVLAAEMRRLMTENEEVAQERDRAYEFLMRWQDWAKDIARERGWVPPDVLPDDTKTREQITAALAENTVMRARLSIQHESDGLE